MHATQLQLSLSTFTTITTTTTNYLFFSLLFRVLSLTSFVKQPTSSNIDEDYSLCSNAFVGPFYSRP